MLVAGAGIIEGSDNSSGAEEFVEFLLSDEAQAYFSQNTKEYPLVPGVAPMRGCLPFRHWPPLTWTLGR